MVSTSVEEDDRHTSCMIFNMISVGRMSIMEGLWAASMSAPIEPIDGSGESWPVDSDGACQETFEDQD